MTHGLSVAACVLFASCRSFKSVSGRVSDYDTHASLAGAEVRANQTGWGIGSNGGIVWDKSYVTRAVTDASGAYTLTFRVGSVANLTAALPGYSGYRDHAVASATVNIRLKRRPDRPAHLPSGLMRLGLHRDGSTYGWRFDSAATVATCDEADLVPSRMRAADSTPVELRACGQGGLRFVSAEELGVSNVFLVYADSAPAAGYAESAMLDFSGAGGVLFVRTRDGQHFAKVEFQPNGFGGQLGPGVVRDLSLRYVYNPDGTRDLTFVEP